MFIFWIYNLNGKNIVPEPKNHDLGINNVKPVKKLYVILKISKLRIIDRLERLTTLPVKEPFKKSLLKKNQESKLNFFYFCFLIR